ncbi:hypothetical protein AGMMS49992_27650 [Clostridia bacterium]|nr:hypothetical protein AGMMS49992_27650 [Clostridia bacterium]
MLSWLNEQGTPIARDYVVPDAPASDGLRTLTRALEAPDGACSLLVELVFKWSANGCVVWQQPSLNQSAKDWPHRIVRAAAAFTTVHGTVDGNLENLMRVLDDAGTYRPDIICLGETAHDMGVSDPLLDRAVHVPDRVIDAIAAKAREYCSYIVVSLNEREGDLVYNTGFLFDRTGGIAGKYKKIQLPLIEAESGVTPGSDFPVFDTNFGKIGIMICWDHGFPEIARILSEKGAEILFLPTLWYTEHQAPARAVDNGVFIVVSCTRWSKVPCRIIAPTGDVIASVQGGDEHDSGVCFAELDLDRRYYTHWLSVGDALGEGAVVYRRERRIDAYPPILEDHA